MYKYNESKVCYHFKKQICYEREVIMTTQGWLSTAIGFFLGMILVFFLDATFESENTMPKSNIAACAVKKDSTLRETTGIAEYIVNFQDGEYTSVRCANETVEE